VTPTKNLACALALALLLAAPAPRSVRAAEPGLSAARSQAIAELGRCKRVAYLNRVGRERLSEFLSGKEALANIEAMSRMQAYDRQLDAWTAELIQAFGAPAVVGLMTPLRPEDERFLASQAYSEPEARTMVDATAREAKACESGQDRLQARLSAP
jgi:hypothetical protein